MSRFNMDKDMYYKRKSNIIYRDYESFGYITDDRNFTYKRRSDNSELGDKIVSQSGAVFLTLLGQEARSIENIIAQANVCFPDVEEDIIRNDAKEFFDVLVKDGFLVSGNSVQECEEKDTRICTNRQGQNIIGEKSKSVDTIDTQDYFNDYYNGRPRLVSLHMEITGECNERCRHCYIPHEKKCNQMSQEMIFNILEQCRKLNLLHITISGGEPLLHNDFIQVLQRCREYNFSVSVLSNLTLLDDEIMDEMERNHLLGVQTSLYSMDPRVHDTITSVEGSFVRTRNAITKLLEKNIPVQISCPIMKSNKNSYRDVIKWGNDIGINVGTDYMILAKYNHTKENLSERLGIKSVQENILHSRESDVKKSEKPEKLDKLPDDFVCSVGSSSMCISETGKAYPCAAWQDYVIGDIRYTSLNDIWLKSSQLEYLRNLRMRDFPECLECGVRKKCAMCMVRNANESATGNPLELNRYYCAITRFAEK